MLWPGSRQPVPRAPILSGSGTAIPPVFRPPAPSKWWQLSGTCRGRSIFYDCPLMTALPLTLDRTNWMEYAARNVDRAQWTAVVAAAGKGSRLGFNRPKILFPVAGRPILEWLLDLLLPSCQTTVFVLSPDGRDEVEPELERLGPGRYRIAIQPVPTGMGDAVEIGAAQEVPRHTVVLWGDQVALRPASVQAVLRLHQGPLSPDLTVPPVFRQ